MACTHLGENGSKRGVDLLQWHIPLVAVRREPADQSLLPLLVGCDQLVTSIDQKSESGLLDTQTHQICCEAVAPDVDANCALERALLIDWRDGRDHHIQLDIAGLH